jgi:hypothetical protein
MTSGRTALEFGTLVHGIKNCKSLLAQGGLLLHDRTRNWLPEQIRRSPARTQLAETA